MYSNLSKLVNCLSMDYLQLSGLQKQKREFDESWEKD
jgi:hypothetical protein